MNNFEEACLMSCENWVDSFSDEEDFAFSEAFEHKMENLTEEMSKNKYHKLTRRTIKALLIAAVVFSFATSAFAIPETRKYIIKQFEDHFSYMVTGVDEMDKIEEISVGYIPEGFKLTKQEISNVGILNEFYNGNQWFNIVKNTLDTVINYDNSQHEIVSINNENYIIIYMENTSSIVWNNGNYTFRITGNIDKDILLEIAKSIK